MSMSFYYLKDMSENTKHELDPRLEVAFIYLKSFCEDNDKIFERKFVKTNTGNIVMICGSDNGSYASVGIDNKDDRLKIFMQDAKRKRWAELEGFSEKEMYDKLDKELIKEATLMELARELIS